MMQTRLKLLCLSLALSGVTLMSGCGQSGPRTYPVQGKVQFADGTPVKFGNVEFYSKPHDLTARGTIQSDGSFALGTFSTNDGAVAGTHEVILVQVVVPGRTTSFEDHGRHVDGRFANYGTSGLEFTVSADGPNEAVFTVE